jgi:hypothetical protein
MKGFYLILIVAIIFCQLAHADGMPILHHKQPGCLVPLKRTLIYYFPPNDRHPIKYLGFFTILDKGPEYLSFCETFRPNEKFYISGHYLAQPYYGDNL